MPLLAVVVSVAVVGGMSTTLAGTISLNSTGSVEFGQGVVTTAACDATIRILPTSSYDSASADMPFNVSSVTFKDIGIKATTDTATAGAGCLGKKLTIKAYDKDGGQLTMNASNVTSIFVVIPDSGTAVANAPSGPNSMTGHFTPPALAVASETESRK